MEKEIKLDELEKTDRDSYINCLIDEVIDIAIDSFLNSRLDLENNKESVINN